MKYALRNILEICLRRNRWKYGSILMDIYVVIFIDIG